MFVIISVIYRPIEQLLSRTIAERRARGHAEHSVRVPIAIQAGFALAFLVVALALQRRARRTSVFDGYDRAVRRAGRRHARLRRQLLRPRLAGGARILRSVRRSRADGVALARSALRWRSLLGIASGQTAVALGIAAAPFVSLVVVPAAFARRGEERREAITRPRHPHDADLARAPITVDEADAALAGPGTEGVQEAAAARRAVAAARDRLRVWPYRASMLSEQTLLNAAVLTVDATLRQTGHWPGSCSTCC